ncbi:N-6 DNA methylase [Streptomyces sp. NPDC046557]|uniref:N-6 DNA methylase n=1 Tax=Streptomyces sp. NPDC046557 TaxID=3155372 RepID=UPI0033FA0EEB
MIALPACLFRSTSIPACVWLLTKDKSPQGVRGLVDRRGEVLFMMPARWGRWSAAQNAC